MSRAVDGNSSTPIQTLEDLVLPPCGGPTDGGNGRRRQAPFHSTQSNGPCNPEGRRGEGKGKWEGRQVRTRERGRPSGQERRILNAVPGSAAEAGAGAAIRCGWRGDGDGGGAGNAGLAGARQRRAAPGLGLTGDEQYSIMSENSIDKFSTVCRVAFLV